MYACNRTSPARQNGQAWKKVEAHRLGFRTNDELKGDAWIAYYFKLNPLEMDDAEWAYFRAMAEYISDELKPKKR